MRLFFYGVLLQGAEQWPFLQGLGEGRAAHTQGALYAIPDPQGWYPALIAGQGTVQGSVFDAGKVDLAAIDHFEGEEYSGRPIMVDAGGYATPAQAYLWQGVLPKKAERIAHGDFNRWLKEGGRAAFSA